MKVIILGCDFGDSAPVIQLLDTALLVEIDSAALRE